MTLHGCHNKPDRKPGYLVQDGWSADGRRLTHYQPDRMSPGCGYTIRNPDDPKCAGCRHKGARNGG